MRCQGEANRESGARESLTPGRSIRSASRFPTGSKAVETVCFESFSVNLWQKAVKNGAEIWLPGGGSTTGSFEVFIKKPVMPGGIPNA
jgi:hypothetical protein